MIPTCISIFVTLNLSGCSQKKEANSSDSEHENHDSTSGDSAPDDVYGVSNVTGWKTLSSGDIHSCGIHTDGTIECWGCQNQHWLYGRDTRRCDPSKGTFDRLSVRTDLNCAISGTEYECWLGDSYEKPDIPVLDISSGVSILCLIDTNQEVQCGDGTNKSYMEPSPHQYLDIEVVTPYVCGLTVDKELYCWGGDVSFPGSPFSQPGPFVDIGLAYSHVCAVYEDGGVDCWGEGIKESPPSGKEYVAVSSGIGFSCALTREGRIDCWGADSVGQSSPPEGTFTEVEAGEYHACAIRDDDHVVCWGHNDAGQRQPP